MTPDMQTPGWTESERCAQLRLVFVEFAVALQLSVWILLDGPGDLLDRLRGATLVAVAPLWMARTGLWSAPRVDGCRDAAPVAPLETARRSPRA